MVFDVVGQCLSKTWFIRLYLPTECTSPIHTSTLVTEIGDNALILYRYIIQSYTRWCLTVSDILFAHGLDTSYFAGRNWKRVHFATDAIEIFSRQSKRIHSFYVHVYWRNVVPALPCASGSMTHRVNTTVEHWFWIHNNRTAQPCLGITNTTITMQSQRKYFIYLYGIWTRDSQGWVIALEVWQRRVKILLVNILFVHFWYTTLLSNDVMVYHLSSIAIWNLIIY